MAGAAQRLIPLLAGGLASRRLPAGLALLAVALALPGLGLGWQLDDHFHRAILLGKDEVGVPPLAIFSSLRGDPERLARFVDDGYGPWWTAEDLRLAFFRSLSAATMWLDYRLWPELPVLMHAHSLLWFGLGVAAVAALYRRLLGATWVAGLAALAWAVDDAHALPAAWLANRNALLTTLFGVLCLLAWDRFRRDGWRPGAWLAPCALALALASGEAALATLGYLAAYALWIDTAPWRNRLAALVPCGAVAALWALVYVLGGYGVHGSGLYLDPSGDPAAYGSALAWRAPLFLLGQWSPIPADVGSLLPRAAAAAMWWVAVVFLALLAAVLVPLVRRDPTARFFAAGMLLSLLPICGTFPASRLLLFVGFGAMGLFAQLAAAAVAEPSLFRRGVAGLLVVVHLVLAPLLLPVAAWSLKPLGDSQTAALLGLPHDDLDGKDLIVVNAPDYLIYASSVVPVRRLAGRSAPRRVRALATGPAAVEILRRDAASLEVRFQEGLFAGPLGRLFRDDEHPLPVGHTVRLTGFSATVLAVRDDGVPTRVLYRFARPMEDPSWRWVRWEDGRFVPFELPAVGAAVRLEPPTGVLELRPGSRAPGR